MKADDIQLTKVHFEGAYYMTKSPPHYVVHVAYFLEDGRAVCWAYNANGAVVWDYFQVDDLEPYKIGGVK